MHCTPRRIDRGSRGDAGHRGGEDATKGQASCFAWRSDKGRMGEERPRTTRRASRTVTETVRLDRCGPGGSRSVAEMTFERTCRWAAERPEGPGAARLLEERAPERVANSGALVATCPGSSVPPRRESARPACRLPRRVSTCAQLVLLRL